MTELFEKAIKEVSKLPTMEQDIVASIVLNEIKSELKWTASFEKSQDFLSSLADEALSDYKKGKTKPFHPDI
jgi:hypothetical protein